jgi:broad specificity phosphatase PhoE
MKKFVNVTYFVHETTFHNEKGIASGWSDIELSERGKEEAIKLRTLTKDKIFDAVFCSDLKRAIETAKIAFVDRLPIIQDKRLREVNYGDLTESDSRIVNSMIFKCIDKPFPNGESYKDVEKRIREFLNGILKNYPGKNIAIVAHRAPQLALEVIINNKSWEQAIKDDWRSKNPKEWKPGWEYKLES